jgi:hypothetical protein
MKDLTVGAATPPPDAVLGLLDGSSGKAKQPRGRRASGADILEAHAEPTEPMKHWSLTEAVALAAKERQDSRVHRIAPLPSLIHCVPRLL